MSDYFRGNLGMTYINNLNPTIGEMTYTVKLDIETMFFRIVENDVITAINKSSVIDSSLVSLGDDLSFESKLWHGCIFESAKTVGSLIVSESSLERVKRILIQYINDKTVIKHNSIRSELKKVKLELKKQTLAMGKLC